MNKNRHHTVVIVLGDVGRSPRMQYHTLSLLENGHDVSLLGYTGEDLIPQLHQWSSSVSTTTEQPQQQEEQPRSVLNVVRFEPYTPPSQLRTNRLLTPLYYVLRLIGLVVGLSRALWFGVPTGYRRAMEQQRAGGGGGGGDDGRSHHDVDLVLVQNPPSVPLLFIAFIYCHLSLASVSNALTILIRVLIILMGFKKKKNKHRRRTGRRRTTHKPPPSSTTQRKRRRRPKLIIDWHNLGHTMFTSYAPSHPIPRLAYFYERIMAPLADGHLCVTNAMKLWLESTFGLTSQKRHIVGVLHDRPMGFFRPTEPKDAHDLWKRLGKDLEVSHPELKRLLRIQDGGVVDDTHDKDESNNDDRTRYESTLFTTRIIDPTNAATTTTEEEAKPIYRLRTDRPALLVSSTSWTPDEDFSLLLDALVKYDAVAADRLSSTADSSSSSSSSSSSTPKPPFPHLLAIITGKGPLLSHYTHRIATLQPPLRHVTVHTAWLSTQDYPKLLGCADVGVSLHVSTSGLDLPMKVLDFFGSGLPVLAVGYPCLEELVIEGVNGRVFGDGEELAALLQGLMGDVRKEVDGDIGGELGRLREGVGEMVRWAENWKKCALPVLEKALVDSGGFMREYVEYEQYVEDAAPIEVKKTN